MRSVARQRAVYRGRLREFHISGLSQHSAAGLRHSRAPPLRPPAPLRRYFIEAILQISLALEADNLLGDLSILEEQQCGNCAHSVLRSQPLFIVDVDLEQGLAAEYGVRAIPT